MTDGQLVATFAPVHESPTAMQQCVEVLHGKRMRIDLVAQCANNLQKSKPATVAVVV